MKRIIPLVLLPISLFFQSCQTTYNPDRPNHSTKVNPEEAVVFVRPDRYTLLGSRSIREHIEVMYDEATLNNAGLLVVNLGLRNKGGQKFYDLRGHSFPISIKTSFYKKPIGPAGPQSPPVYETNWQTVSMIRGDTSTYEAICPVKEGKYYQIRISEQLGRSF